MVTGEGSIQQAFGQAWEVLPPDMQTAYEGALRIQQARIILAGTALFGAMQEGPITETQVKSLQDRLSGMHLSELEQLSVRIEGVAAQLKIPPYGSSELEATVVPFLSVASETLPSDVEQHAKPEVAVDIVAPEPAPELDQPPVATVPEAVAEPAEVKEPTAPEPVGEPESASAQPKTDESSNNRLKSSAGPKQEKLISVQHERRLRSLEIVYGKEKVGELTEQQAAFITERLQALYLDTQKNNPASQKRIAEWNSYFEGLSTQDLAARYSTTIAAVQVGRSNLLKRIRESATLPSLETLKEEAQRAMVSEPEIESQDSQTESSLATKNGNAPTDPAPAAEPIAKSIEASVEPTQEELQQELFSELAVIADMLGMSGREKRALRERLDETRTTLQLSPDAKAALTALATKRKRLEGRDLLTLSPLEREVFELVTGENEERSTYPVPTVRGMMQEALQSAHSTMTSVLLSTIQKMNKASRVSASSA